MDRSADEVLSVKKQPQTSAVQRPYKLIDIIQETPNVKTMRFASEFGEKMQFKPGQFVQIGYSNDGSKIDVQRPYSIGSAPGADVLEFYIEMINGKLTSILDKAKVGDIYNISPPNGKNFEFEPSKNKKSLFIAAATGIAPFMCILRYIEQNHIDEDVIVLYSVKTKADIIKAKELYEFEKRGVAKVVITLTRPGEGDAWSGDTGRIDAEKINKYVRSLKDISPDKKEMVADVTERTIYLCGSNQFNSSMTEILTSLGVPADKEHIKHDVWGGH